MSLRPADESKMGKILEVYKHIIEGKIPGVTVGDITLISDPKHLACYQIADTIYTAGKTVNFVALGIESFLKSDKKDIQK